jgi:hypothetical protein
MYIPGGLIAGAVIGWVIWWLFSTIGEWLSDRREFEEIDRQDQEFNKTHHYDDLDQRWVRNVDGAVLEEYGYRSPSLPPK